MTRWWVLPRLAGINLRHGACKGKKSTNNYGRPRIKRELRMAVRTLIVDDAPTARVILRRRLEAIGCEIVAEADSSAAADDVIVDTVPDLITLDIHMPEIRGMDSYALFRKVRRENPRIEFVVISSPTISRIAGTFSRKGR